MPITAITMYDKVNAVFASLPEGLGRLVIDSNFVPYHDRSFPNIRDLITVGIHLVTLSSSGHIEVFRSLYDREMRSCFSNEKDRRPLITPLTKLRTYDSTKFLYPKRNQYALGDIRTLSCALDIGPPIIPHIVVGGQRVSAGEPIVADHCDDGTLVAVWYEGCNTCQVWDIRRSDIPLTTEPYWKKDSKGLTKDDLWATHTLCGICHNDQFISGDSCGNLTYLSLINNELVLKRTTSIRQPRVTKDAMGPMLFLEARLQPLFDDVMETRGIKGIGSLCFKDSDLYAGCWDGYVRLIRDGKVFSHSQNLGAPINVIACNDEFLCAGVELPRGRVISFKL